MELAYAYKPKEKEGTAIAMGRDLNVSFKDTVMITNKLRGMKLLDAIKLLEDVVAIKRSIPYTRFNKGIGHRTGSHKIGSFPKKAANEVLNVLRNVQSNAEFKGFDAEKLKITNIQALAGISRKKRKPKGRWRLWRTQLVQVQVAVEES